ncbi:MAG: cytidine deaminase [Lachnospiraceae bacterium]|nr:cytidine deaminase [Cuneatibacter sp.]MDD6455512.1 cytidine deaminase [Lachnospiraceae bacterium]
MSNYNASALCRKALEMRAYSYVPYSHFHVGAALLCEDGTVYGGCNIENAAYTPTNCAERTAFFKAVSEGKRSFLAIAIAGGPEGAEKLDYCPPCGVCRQVMREFCGADFEILLAISPTEWRTYTLQELLPESFGPDNLE